MRSSSNLRFTHPPRRVEIEALEGRALMTAVPYAPGGTYAAAVYADQAEIRWRDNSSNENGFVVSKWMGNSWACIGYVPANVTSFTAMGLQAQSTNYFVIGAQNASGTSWGSYIQVVTGPITRRGQQNAAAIDSLGVEWAQKYQPTSYATFCNYFAVDAVAAMGGYLAQAKANQQQQWLAGFSGKQAGWQELGYGSYAGAVAQQRANEGWIVVASWYNPATGPDVHGHIAVVRPWAGAHSSAYGPRVAQAGKSNFNSTWASTGFGASTLPQVRYFALKVG